MIEIIIQNREWVLFIDGNEINRTKNFNRIIRDVKKEVERNSKKWMKQ